MRPGKLRKLMADKGWTATEIAKKLGYTKGTVCAWCKGRSRPSYESLQMLAGLLEVDLKVLMDCFMGYGFEDLDTKKEGGTHD